jgi:hypothetical protein
MRSANCAECARPWNDSAALLLEYNTALRLVAVTPRHDPAYAAQWEDLARVLSDRYPKPRGENISTRRIISVVELRLAYDSSPSARSKDPIMARPELRVSLVPNRRHHRLGGRRLADQLTSYPSSVVSCPACRFRMAAMISFSTDGDTHRLVYRCSDCNHQFGRIIIEE